jgi:hypothetical protein
MVSSPVNLGIKDSWIEKLDLGGARLHSFSWDGGYLGGGKFPPDLEIHGDVSLRNVYVSPNRGRHNIQLLRDGRASLTAKNNLQAASVLHAAELVMNRETESFFPNIVSRIYEYGSLFGNSIGLPILWMFVFWLCAFEIAVCGGTSLNRDSLIGWQAALDGSAAKQQILRAAVYAFGVFNPLNLLAPKSLVAVDCWGAALLCSLFGIAGTISIALLLLSIRRKFKLE